MKRAKRRVVVTVFGGSSPRIPVHYQRAAYRLGYLIAAHGWTLKNGGGKGSSCMGRVTDGALDMGGRVHGVIIRRFLRLLHPGLTIVRIYRHMSERKRDLLRADACIVLPGGFGTLDELGEILALRQAGYRLPPIIILNLGGFFDPLLRWFRTGLARNRFIHPEHLRLMDVVRSPEGAIEAVERHLDSAPRPPAPPPWQPRRAKTSRVFGGSAD